MATDFEKHEADHIHDVEGHKTSDDDSRDALSEFTYGEQRKIIHRVDRRLVSVVGAMYCVSLMDRTNLSAANIAGYEAHCKIHGRRVM
jgi:hypothetical protein